MRHQSGQCSSSKSQPLGHCQHGSSRRGPTPLLLGLALLATAISDQSTHAGGRRFTFVYEATTMPAGEVEYEQWITWKTDKEAEPGFNRIDFRHELEFGVTDNLQLALYVSDWRYQDGDNGGAQWRDVAVEVIYSLLDPVADPIGLALYGELKVGDEFLELEGKLILQKEFGKWVLAWNGIVEAEWEGPDLAEDKGKFEQTFGASYQLSPRLLTGFELLHEVEYDDWSDWGDHAFYLGPNLSYHTGRWWTTITPLLQVTDVASEPDFQLRLIFGIDF